MIETEDGSSIDGDRERLMENVYGKIECTSIQQKFEHKEVK